MIGNHLMKINISQMIDSITIHVPTLIGLGLNANQYMHLALLYHQLPANLAPLDDADMDKLIEKGYLQLVFTTVELTDKGRDLFEASNSFIDDSFKELYELYPRQVSDGKGGYRVLRAKTLDSEDARVCKKKYESIVRNDKKLHSKIMKGLKTELHMRRNSIMYMQNLQTWINQRAWEKYADLDIEDDERISSI